MRVCRFVQLSDIHFGQEQDGAPLHNDVRKMLLKDAAELADRRGAADLIIVVGDTAFSGKETEYRKAGEWLDALAAAVRCGVTDVRVVPGNHDCDRTQIPDWVLDTIHRAIRAATPKSAHSHLRGISKGPEEANPLLPKIKAYRKFALGYDSDFDSMGCPTWTKNFELAAGVVLRLVGMNSVQVSDAEDVSGKMILGDAQYVLEPESHFIYAAILHHPLAWYMDKDEASQYLHSRARILMVGHEHIPNIQMVRDMDDNEWLDIYSGATNPPNAGDSYRYTYNWIEVSLDDKTGSYVLRTTVYPRVWVRERTRFEADIQRLGGGESKRFDIACRELKPLAGATEVMVKTAPTTSAAATAKAFGDCGGSTRGGITPMDDETAFAQLKLLFWRYLDWQQRLKVLVEGDILPASAAQPVPQTMERLALENARRSGKLSAIWDAVMAYVPGDKKQANPFHSARR